MKDNQNPWQQNQAFKSHSDLSDELSDMLLWMEAVDDDLMERWDALDDFFSPESSNRSKSFLCRRNIDRYDLSIDQFEFQLWLIPDTNGYYPGHFTWDGNHCSIHLMPPDAKWSGEENPAADFAPDKKQFIVYADGEEIARLEQAGHARSVRVFDKVRAFFVANEHSE